MSKAKTTNFNFVSDHMTLLVQPPLYKLMYAFLRIVMGVSKEDIIYEKRKRWPGAAKEVSMTFAAKVGEVAKEKSVKIARTAIAVVQPTEPEDQSSHVRTMLESRGSCAHWQHIALRTPDLFGFHRHAAIHGVNFITPIMKDQEEDLLQIFSGELYLPGTKPSGIFFEFVQRDVTPQLLRKLKALDREFWFRDKTFLGLYAEKEKEYQGGHVTPILDHALMLELDALWKGKNLWEVAENDLETAAETMREYTADKKRAGNSRPAAAVK